MSSDNRATSAICLLLRVALTAGLFLAPIGLPVRAAAAGPQWGDDPDLPPFASSANVDVGANLKLRAEHTARLRGWEPGKPFNPNLRIEALKHLEQQFRSAQLLRSAGLASPDISSASWTSIGPAPIPNGQTNGVVTPVSGRVTAIDVHPTNSNIAYVGTAQGGLYRTLDGGTTWTQLMDTAQSLAIGAVTIDPLNPTIVFVGTGEGNLSLDSFFGVGLYRIDSADTSPVVNGPFETRVAGTGTTVSNGHAFVGTAINRIVVDPSNDNRIFVGNTGGGSGMSGEWICCGGTAPPSGYIALYFSPNALSSPTFSRVAISSFNGYQAVTDIVFEPGSSDNMLIGVEDFYGTGLDGIYRTTNASTASQSPSVAPTFTRVLALGEVNSKLAINKVGSTVTALAATETSSGQLLKSTDGGATWPTTLTAANGFCDGQCWYDIGVAIDPGNANNIFLAGNVPGASTRNFAVSTNGGTSFTEQSTGLHADSHAIAIAPSSTTTLYTGNDGGIFKGTFNAGTGSVAWTSLNNTAFNATQFESIAVHPQDAFFSIGGTQDNGTNWYRPNQSWTRADGGDGGFTGIDQNATDTTTVTMYHTYFNSNSAPIIGYARVDSSTNASDGNWTFFGCNGAPGNGINCTDNVLFYAPVVLGPGAPNSVYLGTDRLYRSSDKGVTNTVVSQVFTARVSAIGISPQSDQVRIVGLENGKVLATTTAANPLTDVTGAIPAKYIARAVIDPNNSTTAYVTLDGYGLATNQHVWKTINLSNPSPTWTAIGGTGSNVIGDIPVNAFAVDVNDPNHPGVSVLYAGTDIGVFQSVDGGANWSPFGTGLPRVAVFDMAIQSPHRVLRIATHGRGMWEIALPAIAPTATPTNTATPSLSVTATATRTPTPSPTNTTVPSPSVTATRTPTPTPTNTTVPSPSVTATRTPTPTPTNTTVPSPSVTATRTPTPTPTNTTVPSPSVTATRTPTPTPTPTNTAAPSPSVTATATATPTGVPGTPDISLGTAAGRPGGIACVGATLAAHGAQVAGTSNDISFDSSVFSVSGCTINPLIGAATVPDKQLAMTALGAGAERVGVFGLNINLIPDGLLYSCTLAIGAGAGAGSYALGNVPGASDPTGADITPVSGAAGAVTVTTCTGDCNGNGVVTIGEVIKCVNMFLGQPLCNPTNPVLGCPVADANLDGVVSIGEVVQCVNRFLSGCP